MVAEWAYESGRRNAESEGAMTDLQDFCQEPRTMDELVEAGYKPQTSTTLLSVRS
jgi:hypothetical protein